MDASQSEHARSHHGRSPQNQGGGYPEYAQSALRERSEHSHSHEAHSRAFDDHINAHDSSEPKSAFHLILGERHAVEGMWAAVRAEEELLAQELEEEEQAASERVMQVRE